MAEIISFRDAASSLGRFRGIGTAPAALDTFDTLECPYCKRPTKPSEARSDWSVIYRCACRKVFRIIEDGTICRGMAGPAF